VSDRRFVIEVKDYEPGNEPDTLTTERIERVVTKMLEKDVSDGYVVVTEEQE
jgi:hypothetical protein